MSSRRVWLAVSLLAVAFCIVVYAQSPNSGQQADQQKVIQLENEQIPYALRATMFLDFLADMQEDVPTKGGSSHRMGLLKTLGMEPGSPATTGLVEAALALKAATPPVDPQKHLELEEAKAIAAQRARQLEIHRLAGEAIGTWLRNRDLEDPEIGSMLSKLLNSPYVDMAIGTTDAELNFALIVAKQRAFEQGLTDTLGYVPALMRTADPEDAR